MRREAHCLKSAGRGFGVGEREFFNLKASLVSALDPRGGGVGRPPQFERAAEALAPGRGVEAVRGGGGGAFEVEGEVARGDRDGEIGRPGGGFGETGDGAVEEFGLLRGGRVLHREERKAADRDDDDERVSRPAIHWAMLPPAFGELGYRGGGRGSTREGGKDLKDRRDRKDDGGWEEKRPRNREAGGLDCIAAGSI
jgi:hypothetical protein